MGQWSRDELQTEFDAYLARTDEIARTGNWAAFADNFTEDCVYIEHGYGVMHGREAVREWIVKTMTTFPGSEMPSFPISWHTIDEEKGWVVCELQNVYRDPGDGSFIQEPNITILRYAGHGLWAGEEDAYNPMNFLRTTKKYVRACHANGTLSEDGRAWAQMLNIALD